jgi:hypothetical protein
MSIYVKSFKDAVYAQENVTSYSNSCASHKDSDGAITETDVKPVGGPKKTGFDASHVDTGVQVIASDNTKWPYYDVLASLGQIQIDVYATSTPLTAAALDANAAIKTVQTTLSPLARSTR